MTLNLNLCLNVWTIRAWVGLSYFTCSFLVKWPVSKQKLLKWPWPWSLTYISKNFNLCHSFCTNSRLNSSTELMLYCYLHVPTLNKYYLILSYLIEVGLSYFTCAFLVTRPFRSHKHFGASDLDIYLWPTYMYLKTLTFVITFEPPLTYTSHLTCVISLWNPLKWHQRQWPWDFVHDLNRKNNHFGLCCHQRHLCFTNTSCWLKNLSDCHNLP